MDTKPSQYFVSYTWYDSEIDKRYFGSEVIQHIGILRSEDILELQFQLSHHRPEFDLLGIYRLGA